MMASIRPVTSMLVQRLRCCWLRFKRDTSNPMSPYLWETVHKLAALEGPSVRLPR